MNTKRYHTLTEDNTSASIKIAEMAREFILLPTRIAIWVPGKKISFQEMASMCMKRVKNTRENSLMERNMARAATITAVGLFFRDSGTRIENMDSVSSPTQTLKSTKETGSMAKNMEKEHTITKTETSISVIG